MTLTRADSCAADRLLCMCGSATLAMVVSTPGMIGASMIEIVIMPRLATGAGVSPLTAPPGRRATRTAAR